MSDTVKIRVTSMLNIKFNHVLDTGVDVEDWDDMSTERQNEAAADAILGGAVDWDVVDRPTDGSGARSNRLAGHTLPYEGRVFDSRDPRINRLVNGPGRAQCSCGEWSPDMPSTNARRKWHAAHKAGVRRSGTGEGEARG